MLDLENERILVTGGGGFLGRHLVHRLKMRECADLIYPKKEECDLTDKSEVDALFSGFKPTVVFHLAAVVGGIGANQARPGQFFHDNALMGIHVIDACQKFQARRVVVVGTICVYPRDTPVPFREESLWSGYPEETNAPYGIAKLSLLTMLQSYRTQYGLKGIYLLPVNMMGPGDNFDPKTSHVIPAMIAKMVEARLNGLKEVVLWGTGKATREFLYVDDCAEALVLAAERYEGSQPINLGTGVEITIAGLASKVAEATGYDGRILWDSSKPDGQPRRCLDVSKAEKLLRWRAKTPFKEALAKTVEWYLSRHP